jgi:hypothetical protein
VSLRRLRDDPPEIDFLPVLPVVRADMAAASLALVRFGRRKAAFGQERTLLPG